VFNAWDRQHSQLTVSSERAHLAALAGARMPLRDRTLTVMCAEPGSSEVALSPRPWLTECGSVTLGGLALVADDALGIAIGGAMPPSCVPVSVQLHVELTEVPTPEAKIRAHGSSVHADGRGGVASGSVVDGRTRRTLALATLRSIIAEGASIESAGPDSVAAPEPDARAVQTANPFFANPIGIVHGGILMLAAERAAAQVHADRTPLSMTGTFIRSVVADGSDLSCRVSDIHVGRRVTVTTVDVSRADGALAMTARIVFGEPR